MSCLDELAALADEDLLDFILKDDIPCSEIPVEENGLLEDWSLQNPEILDKELDDFISSMLSPSEDKLGTLQGCSLADSNSGTSEDQHLSYSPSSNSVSSLWSPDIVQVDHNYSLHGGYPVLENVRSEVAEGDSFIDLDTQMNLEGTSEAQKQSSSFPMAGAVDGGPQSVSEAIMQSSFPELVLTAEEKQLLYNEGVQLPNYLPLTKAEERLLKKVRRKIRNKRSARDSRRRKKMYLDGLENRVAACTAQNHKLQKKVQLLKEHNMSLLKQLKKMQTLVRKYTINTTTGKTFTVVVILSFYLVLSPRLCSIWNRKLQPELRVLSRQIREFASQVQEDVAVEVFIPEPEDPSVSGSLNKSQEEGQNPPNPDPKVSFNSSSSYDPLATMASKLSHSQPQDEHSQGDYLQGEVVWKARRQVCMQHAARVVNQQHGADEI